MVLLTGPHWTSCIKKTLTSQTSLCMVFLYEGVYPLYQLFTLTSNTTLKLPDWTASICLFLWLWVTLNFTSLFPWHSYTWYMFSWVGKHKLSLLSCLEVGSSYYFPLFFVLLRMVLYSFLSYIKLPCMVISGHHIIGAKLEAERAPKAQAS